MTTYLTPAGAKQLSQKLSELLSQARPRIVEEVRDAAAQGDRSENAEYIYGKKRLREIDRRIRFLRKRLDDAVVVQPGEADLDTVRFGATVGVVDEEGRESEYLIVGPDEAEPALRKISFQAPIGRALMKRSVGDVVTVHRPSGEIELEIVTLSYRS